MEEQGYTYIRVCVIIAVKEAKGITASRRRISLASKGGHCGKRRRGSDKRSSKGRSLREVLR